MSRQQHFLQIQIPSNPEILCVVRSAVHCLAGITGFKEKECRAITLAVDEALANIIRHAYLSRADQPIDISCRSLGQRKGRSAKHGLEIILVDQGVAATKDKLHGRSLDELRPGGLGLHFMRKSMDGVIYKRVGKSNRLRLVKYLR